MEVEFISQGKVVYTGHITEKIHLNLNTFSIPISQYSEKDSNENISLPPSDFLQKKTERKELEDSFDASNNNISNIKQKQNIDYMIEQQVKADMINYRCLEKEKLTENGKLEEISNTIKSLLYR